MSGPRARPLFVDTSALYAHIDEDDENHERARAVFDGIGAGDLVYRPLLVTGHVIAEVVTLAMHHLRPSAANDALSRLRNSSLFTVLHPDAHSFAAASQQLGRYDDQRITLVDHLTAVLADDRDAGQVFTFDDDFRTLGFTLVPEDVPVP